MKSLLTGLLFLATTCACAENYSFADGRVTFDAPAGFTALSSEEIQAKFPSVRGPSFVVGNERRTTTIAYDWKADALPADKLPEIKTVLEGAFERMIPDVEWKDRSLVEIEGQQWISLEMSSHAIDTDIHNIILVTSLDGRMLAFNFNSTREEFPELEDALRKSLKSIRLKD